MFNSTSFENLFKLFSRVHATLWPTLSVCRSVGPSVGPSVTLSFFSPFYVVLSHFKSFYILTFSLDDRTRLRGVGLVFWMVIFLMWDLILMQPLVDIAYDAVNLLGLDSPVFPKIVAALDVSRTALTFVRLRCLKLYQKCKKIIRMERHLEKEFLMKPWNPNSS